MHASDAAGRFVPVSTGGPSNLFVGTYLPGDGSMFGLKRAMGVDAATPQLRVMDQVARDHALPGDTRDDAIRRAASANVDRYVLGDPVAFAGMALRKADRLWLGYSLGGHRNSRPWVSAYHRLLVALGALGLIAGLVASRGRARALWVLLAAVLYVTAVNAVLVSEARHNLPFMPVLVAGGLAGLAVTLRARAAADGPRAPRLRALLRRGERAGQPDPAPGPA